MPSIKVLTYGKRRRSLAQFYPMIIILGVNGLIAERLIGMI
jgi:hypothetical protein